MSYIFIDESGDLGTKKSSSKYFVMAGIRVDDYKKLDRIITKKRRLSKNNIGYVNEFKATNTPSHIKKSMLKRLNSVDYESFAIVFNKIYRYKVDYKYNNNLLYDVLSSELAKLIFIDNPTFIFLDKNKNKQHEINRFNNKFFNSLNNYKKYPININHVNSFSYKGIQVADLISWSIFQSFEYENIEFVELIKNKNIKKVFED